MIVQHRRNVLTEFLIIEHLKNTLKLYTYSQISYVVVMFCEVVGNTELANVIINKICMSMKL